MNIAIAWGALGRGGLNLTAGPFTQHRSRVYILYDTRLLILVSRLCRTGLGPFKSRILRLNIPFNKYLPTTLSTYLIQRLSYAARFVVVTEAVLVGVDL